MVAVGTGVGMDRLQVTEAAPKLPFGNSRCKDRKICNQQAGRIYHGWVGGWRNRVHKAKALQLVLEEGKGWQRAKYGGGDAGGEAVRKGAGEVAGGID